VENTGSAGTFSLKPTLLKISICLLITLTGLLAARHCSGQAITGVWKGKIRSRNVELKIIKSGDSLTGSSCYFLSRNNFRKFSIRGYFDPEDNAVIWWDDQLIESRGTFESHQPPNLQVTDFNCPGEDKMLLEGTSARRDDKDGESIRITLQKSGPSAFPDPWDWVIDNYTLGANSPEIIDSIGKLVRSSVRVPEPILAKKEIPREKNGIPEAVQTPSGQTGPDPKKITNQEKFASRKNNLQLVIPITGKDIELRFYDNAAIDGDSIAIFLNGQLVREHILLTGEAQTIRINAENLQEDNELVVVAENLGSIPPNTSYLVAIVGKKQYEARLFADEHSSALIRFVKKSAIP
jgi:hypothetical protein